MRSPPLTVVRRRPWFHAAAVLVAATAFGCDTTTPTTPAAPIELPPPLVAGESPTPRAEATSDPATNGPLPPVLRLFYGQATRGELEPCGCPGEPTGGLARKTTLIADVRALWPDALYVEGPDALVRPLGRGELISGELRARARLWLQALEQAKPWVFAPSSLDLEVLGPAELTALLPESTVVATNYGGARPPRFEPYAVREIGGHQILLLSLLGSARTADAARQSPVTDAVAETAIAVSRVPGADFVIAFSAAPWREVRGWIDRGLDVDVLALGPAVEDERVVRREGDRLVVHADPHGRAVRRLSVLFGTQDGRGLNHDSRAAHTLDRLAAAEDVQLERTWALRALGAGAEAPKDRRDPRSPEARLRDGLDSARAEADRVLGRAVPTAGHRAAAHLRTLGEAVPEDGRVRSLVAAFQKDRFDAQVKSEPQAPADGRRYLGRDQCFRCHAEIDAHWARDTAHANAWRTLVERGQQSNPDCIRCHTTGAGEPGGFRDPATDTHLVNVQCEACHGPMEAHVIAATRSSLRPPPGPPVGEATCLRCHDPVNSPTFDFSEALPLVAHPK